MEHELAPFVIGQPSCKGLTARHPHALVAQASVTRAVARYVSDESALRRAIEATLGNQRRSPS